MPVKNKETTRNFWPVLYSLLFAQAVWVGTRFVASVEAGAPQAHKDGVVGAVSSNYLLKNLQPLCFPTVF